MTNAITVEPTTDESYIKSVFLNPSIYAEMCDDSCPKEPSMLAGADIKSIPGFFLRVLVDGVNAGCYWLIWKGTAVEAHTALLENCRGRKAIMATKAAIAWVFGNTSASEIRSYAWSDAPAVAWFCRVVGLRPERTEPWHATRDGRAVDIMWFNLKREEF